MDYTVVIGTNGTKFVTSVNRCIENGYKPQGGMSISVNPQTGETTYAQAMIKETV